MRNLTDTTIGDGSVTGEGTAVVTGVQGVGPDLLTLTLTASSGGGTTVDSINEGGGGAQSGLGIRVVGPNAANSANEAEFGSNNDPINVITETFLLSSADDAGNPVAVNFLSAEVSRLADATESVIVDIGGAATVISGAAGNGSEGGFSTAFAGNPTLAAGDVASFAPGVGTAFRLRSVTVEEVGGVIPEPASVALFAAGCALLAGRRRA